MTKRSQKGAPRKWKIIRFELVYFNPRHNRWQLFQEEDAIPSAGNGEDFDKKGESRHRHYIQQLLGALRETFQTAWDSSRRRIHCPKRGSERQRAICFSTDSEPIKKFVQRFKQISSHPDELWKLILTYIYATLEAHGLSETSKKELRRLISNPQITGLMSAIGSAVQSQESAPVLSRSAALDFLSCLPILEHWDVCGLISSHSCESTDEAPTKVAHESLRNFRNAIESDQYFAQRLAFGTEETNGDQVSSSQQLLGYDVRLELFARMTKRGPSTELGPSDFFEICHEPALNHKGNERALYMAYAYFVDQIQEGLQGDNGAKNPSVYTIWYPVRALGWNHYLQIYLSPTNLNSGQDDQRRPPNAKELWIDWSIAQRDLGWNRVRSYLTQQLEFVGLSYFQFEVLQKLKKASSELASAKGLLAEFCFCLAPLEKVSDGKQLWSYVKPYRWPPDKKEDEVRRWAVEMNKQWTHFSDYAWPRGPGPAEESPLEIWVGEQWRPKAAPASNHFEASADPTGSEAFFKADGETLPFRAASIHQNGPLPYLDELHRSCVRQMVEEQLEFVKELVKAKAEEKRQIRELRGEQRKQTLLKMRLLKHAQLHKWNQELTGISSLGQLEELYLPVGQEASEPARELFAGWIDSESEQDMPSLRSKLLSLVQQPIPLALSEYLGVGPVKNLTHRDQNYYRGSHSVADDLAKCFSRMSEQIAMHGGSDPEPEHLTQWLLQIKEFHATCAKMPKYEYNKQLFDSRKKLILNWGSLVNELSVSCQTLSPAVTEQEGLSAYRNARHIDTGMSFEVHYPIGKAFGQGLLRTFNTANLNGDARVSTFSLPAELHPGPAFWTSEKYRPITLACYIAIAFESRNQFNYNLLRSTPIGALEELAQAEFYKYGKLWLFYRREDEWVGVDMAQGRDGLPTDEASALVRPGNTFLATDVLLSIGGNGSDGLQTCETIRNTIVPSEAKPKHSVLLFEFRTWRQHQ